MQAFAATYSSPATQRNYREWLNGLFRATNVQHPAALTVESVLDWCQRSQGRRLANNTVRQRLSLIRQFFTWCDEHDMAHPVISPSVLARVRKSHPRTYGKAQGIYPARWLTQEEAFVTLVGACRDGTLCERSLRFAFCDHANSRRVSGSSWPD